MSRNSLYSLLAGLVVTLLVVFADGLGLLAARENLTIDWRYRSGLRTTRPMSPQVALVGIDDTAIVRIGRWPWPRNRLADVVTELKRQGAKTIALDLILSEKQGYLDDYTGPRVHDAEFADALAAKSPQNAQCVLGVVLSEDPAKNELWLDDEGEAQWNDLLDALGKNIRDATGAAEVLDGDRRSLFEERPLKFTEAAAWRVLRRKRVDPYGTDDFDLFEEAVVPNPEERVAVYPERKTLEATLEQSAAWDLLSGKLLPDANVRFAVDEEGQGDEDHFRDRGPISLLAGTADGVGFTNSRTREQRRQMKRSSDARAELSGEDPTVRELEVSLSAPGGQALQFGIAAAARHLGIEPADIVVTRDRITFERANRSPVHVPLRNGQIRMHWPTSESNPKWEGIALPGDDATSEAPAATVDMPTPETSGPEMLAIAREKARRQGILPVRTLIELAESRRADERNQAQFAERTGALLTRYFLDLNIAPGDETKPATLEAVRGEVEKLKASPVYASRESVRDAIRRWEEYDRAVAQFDRARFDYQEAFANAFVKDKLVIVGWNATGALADVVATPLGAQTPGFIVHAVSADMIVRALGGEEDAYATSATDWQRLALIILMAGLCTMAAARLSVVLSVIAMFVVVIGYEAAAVAAFVSQDWIIPMVAPFVSGAGSWSAVTVKQSWRAQQDRARITRQFKARVSSQLVEKLVGDPNAISVSGEERVITVLFTDMKGFTSISEGLEDKDLVVGTLNRYMGEYTRALIAHDAYVNKFLGDGVMAFWSAFAPDPDQATKACRAALECQIATERVNQFPDLSEVPNISLRIGIATGKLVVGDCGAPPDLNDYTVIGDAANLAARLESANKKFGTQIIMDGTTKESVEERLEATGGQAPGRFRAIGLIGVVGQKHETEVFNLLPAHASSELITLTEKAVQAYRTGAFSEAKAAFDELEKRFGSSPLIENYRAALDEVPAEPFRGVLRLRDK